MWTVACGLCTLSITASPTCRFCNGLKCPEFKTVKLYDTYQEREYENSTWAYTKISSLVMEPAQMRGFKVRWFAGCNKKGLLFQCCADAYMPPHSGCSSTSRAQMPRSRRYP